MKRSVEIENDVHKTIYTNTNEGTVSGRISEERWAVIRKQRTDEQQQEVERRDWKRMRRKHNY